MLGQHPETYGLPEVNLFIADTVAELTAMHRARPHGMHGLLRALAQINDKAQTDETVERARAWLEQRSNWSTRQVYEYIVKSVAPRIAVDKSPRTSMKPEYLERAYNMFPQASFLHLTRHPRSTANSFVANLQRNHEWGGTFNADQVDPEKIWLRTHQNIVDFAATLPEGQCMRIKGEDLLSDPELYLPQIAEWLGLDAGPEAIAAMLHPENSPFAHVGPEQARLGNDPEFLEDPALRRGKITAPSLAGELEWAPAREFSAQTTKLAKQLGYA